MTQAYQPGMIPSFDKPDRIKKALQVSGVGVAEMAEYVGVTRETLSRYMSGKQDAPLAIVRLVAMRTGVPFNWIQNGETPSPDGDGVPSVRPKGFEPLTFWYAPGDALNSAFVPLRRLAVSGPGRAA